MNRLRTTSFIAIGFALLLGSAAASDTAVAAETESVRLQGILISSSTRSALINGLVAREGERVAGATVVAITEDQVRLQKDAYELVVVVGGSSSWSRATRRAEPRPATRVARRDRERDEAPQPGRHTVAPGETLSAIAARYLHSGTDLDRMMLAIFDGNPHAFAGNIHRLRAGAKLELPAADAVAGTAYASAASDVARHTAAWRAKTMVPSAAPAATDRYGPVRAGESLSTIAARIQDSRYSLEQKMIALFAANPQAFGANINVLYEGATLRLPQADALGELSAERAAAEVARHAAAWRGEDMRDLIARNAPAAAGR